MTVQIGRGHVEIARRFPGTMASMNDEIEKLMGDNSMLEKGQQHFHSSASQYMHANRVFDE